MKILPNIKYSLILRVQNSLAAWIRWLYSSACLPPPRRHLLSAHWCKHRVMESSSEDQCFNGSYIFLGLWGIFKMKYNANISSDAWERFLFFFFQLRVLILSDGFKIWIYQSRKQEVTAGFTCFNWSCFSPYHTHYESISLPFMKIYLTYF